MNRATQLGLVLLAFAAAAGASSTALALTNQTPEANLIAWTAWWTALAGALVAIVGITTGRLLGLLRNGAGP